MKESISKIAAGYLLLHLDFSLGTLQLLPNWGGYLLILSALEPLSEKVPSARLLKPLAILLAAWEAFCWVATLIGYDADFWLLTLIAGIIELYFHFQFLTDLATAAAEYGWPEHRKLLHLRTARTLLSAFLLLPLPWESFSVAVVLLLLVHVIVLLWITAVLFGLKRYIKETEA